MTKPKPRYERFVRPPGPYDFYEQLDLGPGGYASVPSSESRRGVAEALRKKLRKSSIRVR